MAKILHIANSFDPAGDVTRSVTLLKRFSKHQHEVIVRERHPFQSQYGFEEPALMDWNTNEGVWLDLCDWADAFLFHFVGFERTPVSSPLKAIKPWAFRNSNVYFYAPEGRFYCIEEYNARSLREYDLVASSHLGAQDFLGKDCRFLPALLDLDEPLLRPNLKEKKECVGYTKHADILRRFKFEDKKSIHLTGTRPKILHSMRENVTMMVDNVTDGHYGLASMEAMSMGVIPICYWHPTTYLQLADIADAQHLPPTINVHMQNYTDLVKATQFGRTTIDQRILARRWMETYYNAPRLIERYWDKFLDELVSK